MINEYDRPVKGYKTAEQYEHPATVLYDNFAPSEEVFVETAVEETPIEETPIEEEIISDAMEEVAPEIIESEGENND